MSSGLQVMKQQCDQCLFSKNRIVSAKRAKQVIADCLAKDTYFVCHKASIRHEEVACAGFVERYKFDVTLIRAAFIFSAIHYVQCEETTYDSRSDETRPDSA